VSKIEDFRSATALLWYNDWERMDG